MATSYFKIYHLFVFLYTFHYTLNLYYYIKCGAFFIKSVFGAEETVELFLHTVLGGFAC